VNPERLFYGAVRGGVKPRESNPVVEAHHPGVGGAVGTTVDLLPGLDAVADHFAAAMGALGSKRMNGALEAVIVVDVALHNDLDGLVVIIPADFAFHTHTTGGQPQPGARLPL